MALKNMPSLIKDTSKRITTMCKRKRGLFKKAIELSRLCGVEVFMVVFDPEKQKMFELNSQADFNIKVIDHMLDKVNRQQFMNKYYTNEDYQLFDSAKPEKENESTVSDDFDPEYQRKRAVKNYKKE